MFGRRQAALPLDLFTNVYEAARKGAASVVPAGGAPASGNSATSTVSSAADCAVNFMAPYCGTLTTPTRKISIDRDTLAAAAYWAYKGDHDHTPSASPDQFLST